MNLGLLHRCEVAIYFSVYILYIGVGLYQIYLLRDRIVSQARYGFTPGWPLLGRKRDNTNDDFANFRDYLGIYWPYFIIHLLVSSITKWKWPQLKQHGHVAVSALALLASLHWTSLSIFAAVLSSFYLAGKRRSKKVTWLLAISWLCFMDVVKNNDWWMRQVDFAETVMVVVSFGWSVLRGCSYCLTKSSTNNLVDFLGYMLYFPSLTTGPLISYERYRTKRETNGWPHLLQSLLRCAFWWLVVQVSFHYIYVPYMTKHVEVVGWIPSVFWCYAVGYFLGQFFNTYYMITYGMGVAFAEFDGIASPSKPRCIGRVHFYSDMWKYFDEGLYEFLFKHIYVEVCRKDSSVLLKLWGTTLTFIFVYFWHGCYTFVFIWSALNCICLIAEKFYKALIDMPAYQNWMHKHLGFGGTQRFNALLATQIFIPAAFSNVYFIGGLDIGNFLMRCAYLSGVGNYLALSFCTYCFFQCSEIVAESKNRQKVKEKLTEKQL
ncbi:rasp [Drosophila busckii]|uniref:Rasp n=2 Tax=Drosophila busckii TaxID=30019 RepID=A0A0M4EL81_DROBS|nr:rasp [Drosophila busckii]